MKQLVKKAWSNVFFQGSFFYTVTNFINIFINYLFNVFAAKTLGPHDFGEISAFFSYLILLTTPIGIVSTFLIIKIGESKNPKDYSASVLAWLHGKIKKFWIFCIPLLLIVPFVPKLTNLSPLVVYTLVPTVIAMYFLAIYEGEIQGLHLFRINSLYGVVFSAVKLLGAVIIYFTTSNLWVVMLFIFLAFFVKFILSYLLLKKTLIKAKVSHISKSILEVIKDKHLLLTLISSVSIAILTNLDIIYVKKMFTGEDAGIYASWSLFGKVIINSLGPLISLSFVFFSSKKHELQHQLFFICAFLSLAVIGFISLIVYGTYSRVFIDTFLGPKFYPVIPFVEWASLYGTGFVMLIFMNNYYLAKGSKKAYILAAAIPVYIVCLFIFGKGIGDVILINIWFSFIVVAVYLLLFFKARFASLWE